MTVLGWRIHRRPETRAGRAAHKLVEYVLVCTALGALLVGHYSPGALPGVLS